MQLIIFIIISIVVMYIWITYVIPAFINRVVKANPNSDFLRNNQQVITKGFQGFYWCALVMVVISSLSWLFE